MSRPRFRLRGADETDAAFLEDMFVVAADWHPERVRGAESWRSDPSMTKYIGDWKRDDDVGFIVETRGEPVGAVWLRYFTADAPGYGFVDEQTPELSIGVLGGFRGEGVGTLLLQAAVDAAPAALSLSVEDGNDARRLYERFDFVPVGRVGNSTTMLRAASPTGVVVASRF